MIKIIFNIVTNVNQLNILMTFYKKADNMKILQAKVCIYAKTSSRLHKIVIDYDYDYFQYSYQCEPFKHFNDFS